MADEAKTFLVEDARIIFRNFAGKEGQYNRQGDRNFCVVLDEPTAARLSEDGWNVHWLEPREEGDAPTPYIQVAVDFTKNRPPRIWLLTSTNRSPIDENTVEMLDWADFALVDLIARAYEWEVNGKTGIKAYLQSLFITIEEDDLERKYSIHESPGNLNA